MTQRPQAAKVKHPVDSLEGGLQGDCEWLSLTCVLEVTWDVAASSRSPCERSLPDSRQGTGLTQGWIRSA